MTTEDKNNKDLHKKAKESEREYFERLYPRPDNKGDKTNK